MGNGKLFQGVWTALELTQDHKPESPEETRRINLAGGKVITKAGVPRVVWHRPKTQGLGRQLRSTKTDEIPFLAIARSLGDLWSYNSLTGQFVVSPEPDLAVYEIDAKKHKCLIFGTDGLWNVIDPQVAVNLVYGATNEGNVNPSNCLVDEALQSWNQNRKRADNVSVLTMMLNVEDDKVPENENIAFLEDEEVFPPNHDYHLDDYEAPSEYMWSQGINATDCASLYPKRVMRQFHVNTFERYNYMRDETSAS